MRLRGVAVVGTALALACGCGTATTPGTHAQELGARQAVVDNLTARARAGDRADTWYRTLGEALPSVRYATPDGETLRASDLVVIGSVSTVRAGIGGKAEGDVWIETSFNDPEAVVRTYHLTVAIETVIAGRIGRTVEVGVALGDSVSPETAFAGLRELGRMILFLSAESPVYEYDDHLYAVLEDGGLTAFVTPSGTLSLPFVDEDRARVLLSESPSVESLIELADREVRIPLERLDGSSELVRA